MVAAKFTLEILAAPVEVKFATSFTSFFGETFCFQVIPKQVSSPTHFSLCGRRDPQCFPKGCPGTPRLSHQGRKMKIQAAQVGLGTKPFLQRCRVVHPKMKAQRLWWQSPHGPPGSPQRVGKQTFPLPTSRGKPCPAVGLNGNLALMFLTSSFFGNLPEFCQRGARAKAEGGGQDLACSGEAHQRFKLIKTATVGYELLYQTESLNPVQIVYIVCGFCHTLHIITLNDSVKMWGFSMPELFMS